MKGNVINLNTLHLNSVRLNGIGKVQSVSLKGGSTEDPVFPPVEPPVEPTPTYTLSASVTNGKVSAKRNGSAVNLPFTANEGDVIVVEVTPNDGYTFEGWADGVTDNPRSITMTADVALSAQCVEVVQPPVGNYIQFEDPAVEAICVANWSSDGIGLTEEDAAAVASIGTTFQGNTEITSFNELRYFTGVTTLSNGAFKNCSALREIDLSHITRVGLNTVWNNGSFFGCSSLESVNMPIAVEIANYSFNKCSSLKSAQMPNAEIIGANAFEYTILEGVIDIPKAKTISASAFRGTNITELLAPSAQKFDGAWATGVCQGCKYLVKVDVGVSSSLGERTFEGCKALETFIIRATTPPSLNGNLLSNTNSTFLIYVPDASLEAYKTAVNWSAYADRIHPLSEIEGSNGVTLYDRLYGDGSAYIETDYFLKGNERIESNASNAFTDKNSKTLWGANDGTTMTAFYTGGDSSANSIQYVIYYGSTSYLVSAYLSTSIPSTTFVLTPKNYGWNNNLFNLNGKNNGVNSPFCIFADNEQRAHKFKGWIGSVIITDTDTSEVLAKFTPASYNGEAGMYDEVSGKFYGNAAASGAFYVENE